MAKLISTKGYITFLDPKFYRNEHMIEIEFNKYSQIFLNKETIYHN